MAETPLEKAIRRSTKANCACGICDERRLLVAEIARLRALHPAPGEQGWHARWVALTREVGADMLVGTVEVSGAFLHRMAAIEARIPATLPAPPSSASKENVK